MIFLMIVKALVVGPLKNNFLFAAFLRKYDKKTPFDHNCLIINALPCTRYLIKSERVFYILWTGNRTISTSGAVEYQ